MQEHPVRRNLGEVTRILTDTVELPVEFMGTADKRAALDELAAVTARLDYLRLQLINASSDVADEDGARDVAAWLTTHTLTDRGTNARQQRVAQALDRWPRVAAALASGWIQLSQAEALVLALDALPDDLPRELVAQAEAHLVEEAREFGPRDLRVLGRRVLDVAAPEISEEHERRLLDAEEEHAHRTTSLSSQHHGDGTTTVRLRLPHPSADRLFAYVEAFAAPRQGDSDAELRHDQRLGHAFCALLEHLDPGRLPRHGGDATTVVVTVDLATLRHGLGTATVGVDGTITASEARRLACTARLLPAVLGTDSEPLDLGRTARLFSPAQRKAMRLRDRTCRATGCTVPATWCEAHHFGRPWASGGKTDLAAGKLLCNWHHHRAHDDRYHHTELPNGDVRFRRRT